MSQGGLTRNSEYYQRLVTVSCHGMSGVVTTDKGDIDDTDHNKEGETEVMTKGGTLKSTTEVAM